MVWPIKEQGKCPCFSFGWSVITASANFHAFLEAAGPSMAESPKPGLGWLLITHGVSLSNFIAQVLCVPGKKRSIDHPIWPS